MRINTSRDIYRCYAQDSNRIEFTRFQLVSNKALVNAFLICLIARYPPFLLRTESPSASACAIALVSSCEHVQRCVGLKRLRVIVCKGNKNKSYTPYLITIFFYFLPFFRGKTQKKTSGEPYLAPPISSLLKLFFRDLCSSVWHPRASCRYRTDPH